MNRMATYIPEISASKAAGFIGLHKYQTAHEIAYELLHKHAPTKAKIAEIERVNHRRSFAQVVNEVMRDGPIQDCVYSGIKAAQTTSNVVGVLEEVEEQAKVILELRRDSFTPEVRALIAAEVRGKVSKQRGLNNENKILDQYETARDVKVTERNTKTLKKDFGSFKLVGRTDGFVASENRIVDSKDRTRFWPQVPLYDEIQLRCYMAMSGATESELVERFPDGQVRHTKFANDPEKWNALQTAMERAADKLRLAIEDDEELTRIVYANTVCTQANGGSPPRRRPSGMDI
jgi:hypothetical protein